MSRKKNGNQNQSASLNLNETKTSIETNKIIRNASSASDNSSNKNAITAYIKAHWWTVALIVFLTISAFGVGLKYMEDRAQRNAANGTNPNGEKDRSLLSKLNPFAPSAMPSVSPTPLPMSKEYIYAGSRLLAVEDANVTAAPPADLAIWRPSSGVWWVMGRSNSQQVTQQWGQSGDKPVPSDYDGDGKPTLPFSDRMRQIKSATGTSSTAQRTRGCKFNGDSIPTAQI